MLSFDGLALATSLEDRFVSIGQLCEVLKNSEALSSLYFGYGTGDFFMLTQLPFPKHLRDVPEIAACHHEKMDGTGYPRRLMREQMGPVARMMAIADIFEALTAVDRPYKKGKTLSEALRIMARMRDEQHIDPDLFELFLSSGVWRDYAERFLRPEQVDAVDLASFAGTSA